LLTCEAQVRVRKAYYWNCDVPGEWSAIRQLKVESAKPASNVHVARYSGTARTP
jgi:hypothetical protein